MTVSDATAAVVQRHRWHRWFRRRPLLSVACGLVVIQLAMALTAPLIAPYDPLAQDILARLKGPTAAHWLGADQFGRDLLSRILYGYRSSLSIAGTSVTIALMIGGTLGVMAAYYGGWFDRIVMRMMDVLFAFPIILLAIGVIAVLGPGHWTTAIAIGVVYTPIFARLLRGPGLVIATSDYVMGARCAGAGDARILLWHILPNLSSLVLVQTSLLLSTAILVEASLSFLGLGTQPPTPSLGLMLSEGRAYMLLSPWTSVFSGLAILLVSFGFNLLGDALRDTLDPRLRGVD